MATFNSLLQLTAQGSYIDGSLKNFANIAEQLSLASGVAANQCDIGYYKRRTVVDSSTPDTFDLAGGSLIGLNGATITFVKVVLLLLWSRATSDSHRLTGGGGTNSPAWLPTQEVGGINGVLLKFDPSLTGYAVTAGTGDIVRVQTAAGTNVPYDALVLGRSA